MKPQETGDIYEWFGSQDKANQTWVRAGPAKIQKYYCICPNTCHRPSACDVYDSTSLTSQANACLIDYPMKQ